MKKIKIMSALLLTCLAMTGCKPDPKPDPKPANTTQNSKEKTVETEKKSTEKADKDKKEQGEASSKKEQEEAKRIKDRQLIKKLKAEKEKNEADKLQVKGASNEEATPSQKKAQSKKIEQAKQIKEQDTDKQNKPKKEKVQAEPQKSEKGTLANEKKLAKEKEKQNKIEKEAKKANTIQQQLQNEKERIWFIGYTQDKAKINADNIIEQVMISKNGKIKVYDTAGTGSTLKKLENKSADELVAELEKTNKAQFERSKSLMIEDLKEQIKELKEEQEEAKLADEETDLNKEEMKELEKIVAYLSKEKEYQPVKWQKPEITVELNKSGKIVRNEEILFTDYNQLSSIPEDYDEKGQLKQEAIQKTGLISFNDTLLNEKLSDKLYSGYLTIDDLSDEEEDEFYYIITETTPDSKEFELDSKKADGVTIIDAIDR